MAQDDTVTFKNFQLLPMSKVDQSQLSIYEVPPLQYPKNHIIVLIPQYCLIFRMAIYYKPVSDTLEKWRIKRYLT